MEDCLTQPYTTSTDKTHSARVATDNSDKDFTIYPVADLPIPFGIDSKENEILFLDPTIGEGKRIINEKSTSIPHLFSILRQFIRPVCHNIGSVVDEMLKKGININDVDATTGMSILHYAVRATALSEKRGLIIVKKLLSNGADPRQRCLFSGMNALHIAVYFDIASVVRLLLKPCDLWPSVDVNSLCDTFEFGTSLHIAAASLSSNVIEILLQKGANPHIKNDLDQLPIDCLPTDFKRAEDHKHARVIKDFLTKYSEPDDAVKSESSQKSSLTIGSKVEIFFNEMVEGGKSAQSVKKSGTIRYIGKLPKSTDIWAGIELETPDGQNNGAIGKKVYFKCKKNHGVFIRLSMVSPVHKRKSATMSPRKDSSESLKCRYKIGDRVMVAGTMEGYVRFVGETQFATGIWCGVELDEAGPGKNNGSVGDVSYFTCPPSKGVFSPPSKLALIRKASPQTPNGESKLRTESPQESAKVRFQVAEADKSDQVLNEPHPLTSRKITAQRDCPYLHPGMHVTVSGTETTGTIKFVGKTDFASGLWVGLDLGVLRGRNDGTVRGRQYFQCPPLHGLMVRPHRIAYNGMTGDTLLPPEFS